MTAAAITIAIDVFIPAPQPGGATGEAWLHDGAEEFLPTRVAYRGNRTRSQDHSFTFSCPRAELGVPPRRLQAPRASSNFRIRRSARAFMSVGSPCLRLSAW